MSTTNELTTRVEALIRSGVLENSSLDYKRDPYAMTEGGRKEFAKDLSAFANKNGGLIVIGVSEKDGAPDAVVGVNPADVDSIIMWLESVARSGVSPHLPGLVIKSPTVDGKALVAVDVPRGMDQPYEVAAAGSRFFVRDERSVRTMSREEIKFAVSRAADLMDRVDEFVRYRANVFEAAMRPGTGALLVVTPIFDETLAYRFDLPTVAAEVSVLRSIDGRTVGALRPQLEGLHCSFDSLPDQVPGYGRIFRHGAIELVDGYMCGLRPDGMPIPGTLLVRGLIAAVKDSISLARRITGAENFAIDFRLKLRQGQRIAFYNHFDHGPGEVDTPNMVLDRLLLSAIEIDKSSFEALMRPLLDQLWQSFGYLNCSYYQSDGSFKTPG